MVDKYLLYTGKFGGVFFFAARTLLFLFYLMNGNIDNLQTFNKYFIIVFAAELFCHYLYYAGTIGCAVKNRLKRISQIKGTWSVSILNRSDGLMPLYSLAGDLLMIGYITLQGLSVIHGLLVVFIIDFCLMSMKNKSENIIFEEYTKNQGGDADVSD